MRPLIAIAVLCVFQACIWGRRDSSDLERSLRSQPNLVVARLPGRAPELWITHLDGRFERRALECCANPQAATISRNRIILVDRTLLFVGTVVLLNPAGQIEARSKVPILRADLLSLSPDTTRFAFLGNVPGWTGVGVFIADFTGP